MPPTPHLRPAIVPAKKKTLASLSNSLHSQQETTGYRKQLTWSTVLRRFPSLLISRPSWNHWKQNYWNNGKIKKLPATQKAKTTLPLFTPSRWQNLRPRNKTQQHHQEFLHPCNNIYVISLWSNSQKYHGKSQGAKLQSPIPYGKFCTVSFCFVLLFFLFFSLL